MAAQTRNDGPLVTEVAVVAIYVRDLARALDFYRDHLGFAVDALYDDPPYATLTRAGVRLSLAEQGHPALDRPGIALAVPSDPTRLSAMAVPGVTDAAPVPTQWGTED